MSGELPDPLLDLLSGDDLERKEGETLLLLTVADEGWPRVALLSVGEVLAISSRELHLALYPASTTTANLTRVGRATIAAFAGGAVYYVELAARRLDDLRGPHAVLARFTAEVRSVRTDLVGYAELVSWVRFRLVDRDRVLRRWRETVMALRE